MIDQALEASAWVTDKGIELECLPVYLKHKVKVTTDKYELDVGDTIGMKMVNLQCVGYMVRGPDMKDYQFLNKDIFEKHATKVADL